MSEKTIDYDKMVQTALMSVVRRILEDTAQNGLVGEHHFYITFNVKHPHVVIPAHLKEKYPNDMTIVLQNQFWDMIVTDSFFEISLSFNRMKEHLHIPFDALIGFLDPSVDFGLHFNDEALGTEENSKDLRSTDTDIEPDVNSSKVVTLDSFRKK